MMTERIEIDKATVDKWNAILRQSGNAFDGDGSLSPVGRCLFVRTAEFEDGTLCDVKVCASGPYRWVEAVAYDSHGHKLWSSPSVDNLLWGWKFYLVKVDGSTAAYSVEVVQGTPSRKKWETLGESRDDFRETVQEELENGVTKEYSAQIAEFIVDRVAEDIIETADVENWSMGDLRLGIGRVLLHLVTNAN